MAREGESVTYPGPFPFFFSALVLCKSTLLLPVQLLEQLCLERPLIWNAGILWGHALLAQLLLLFSLLFVVFFDFLDDFVFLLQGHTLAFRLLALLRHLEDLLRS